MGFATGFKIICQKFRNYVKYTLLHFDKYEIVNKSFIPKCDTT